jgi:hypothetical protein
MTLSRRLTIAACCLGLGLAGMLALEVHLHSGETLAYPPLKQRLTDFPEQLGAFGTRAGAGWSASPGWVGGTARPGQQIASVPVSLGAWQRVKDRDLARLPPEQQHALIFARQAKEVQRIAQIPDHVINWTYALPSGGPAVNLYAVYSPTGEDREHHPEICIRDVGGKPEDRAARAVVPLDAEGQRAVQRFRYRTGGSTFTSVWYWHYTLEPLNRDRHSALQRLR